MYRESTCSPPPDQQRGQEGEGEGEEGDGGSERGVHESDGSKVEDDSGTFGNCNNKTDDKWRAS